MARESLQTIIVLRDNCDRGCAVRLQTPYLLYYTLISVSVKRFSKYIFYFLPTMDKSRSLMMGISARGRPVFVTARFRLVFSGADCAGLAMAVTT